MRTHTSVQYVWMIIVYQAWSDALTIYTAAMLSQVQAGNIRILEVYATLLFLVLEIGGKISTPRLLR